MIGKTPGGAKNGTWSLVVFIGLIMILVTHTFTTLICQRNATRAAHAISHQY